MSKTELFSENLYGRFVVVDEGQSTGTRFWVDSGHANAADDASHGRTPEDPFATLAYAFSSDLLTASSGDIVFLAEGHAETVDAAGDIAMDIAGVRVVGLGEGDARPTITFATATDADINITADDIAVENVLFYCNIDSLDIALDLSGDDFHLINCEFRDAASNKEANIWLDASSAADRLYISGLKYNGLIAGDACTQVIVLNGGTGCIIENSSFYGEVSTGVIDMAANSYDVEVRNCYFYNDNTALTKNVVDSGGSSTWAVHDCFDGKGGYGFSGGSAAAVASDDVSTLATLIGTADATTTDSLHGKIGTDTEMADNSLYDLLGGAGLKTDSLHNILMGGTGIATYPTAARYANGVSLAEVLAYVQDAVRNGTGTGMASNKGVADALGTNGTTVTDSAVSVLGAIGANNNNNAFDSSTVVANANGSVLERQDAQGYLQGVATADTTDPVDMTAEVVDNSVLSHVITDDGDVSDYDRRYMSLEALAKLLQVQFGYTLKSVPGSAMPVAIWFVDANIAASGDGKTAATAFKTMAEAITACSNTVDDWVLVYDYSGGDAGTITIDKAFVHIIGNANASMPYPRIFPASAAPGFTLGDSADRVEIANLVIGGGDQTVAAILFNGAAGSYGCYIHDCVIGRDAAAPGLYGVYVQAGADAPYLTIENNKFYGSDGAGIAAAGSAIRIAGNATRCNILGNYVQDVGRTATPAIWLDGGVTNPRIENNRIKTDTDTGTGSAITLGASVDDGWISGNWASDGKDAPAQNPFVDGGSTNGWSENYSGIVAVLPA